MTVACREVEDTRIRDRQPKRKKNRNLEASWLKGNYSFNSVVKAHVALFDPLSRTLTQIEVGQRELRF